MAKKIQKESINQGAENASTLGTVYVMCTLMFFIMVAIMISSDTNEQGPPSFIAGVFKLLMLILAGAMLIGYTLVSYGSEIVGKHYNELRCSPIIMPFVGVMGKDSSENMQQCFWLYFKSQIDLMMKPIYAMNSMVLQMVKTLSTQLNTMYTLFAPFQFMIDIALRQFYFQMSKTMTTIAFLQAKSRNLLSRLSASYNISQKTLDLSNYTVKGFANSKIMTINKDWAKTKDFFSKSPV